MSDPKSSAPNMRELAALYDCTQLAMRLITGLDDDLVESVELCRKNKDFLEALSSAQKKLALVLKVKYEGLVEINPTEDGGIQCAYFPKENGQKPGDPNDN